jgi:anti-sigma-K factor RskA
MSQFNLTAKEYQLVLDSVRARHAQILSAYGVEDTDLAVLMDKIQSQLTPVVEAVAQADPPDVVAAEEAAEAHLAAQEADEQE